jgi:uncharacterized Zn-finger protein
MIDQSVTYVDKDVVFCDQGHPGVYISVPETGFVYCLYCNKKFQRK